MAYPNHDNTVPPFYQTLHHNEDEGHGRSHGPRLGNRGVFGTYQLPIVDYGSHDGRGVVVEMQEWWGCEPIAGEIERVQLLQSETVAYITSDHDLVHTDVVIPRHLLVEHRESWAIEVTARTMYIAAGTETPQEIVARLGFEWDEGALKYVALDGVSFSKADCRWFSSWDIPMWDLTRVLRFRHFVGNAGGCLDIQIVAHSVYPRDGDELPLDLVAFYA
jgi:hypothetical protein